MATLVISGVSTVLMSMFIRIAMQTIHNTVKKKTKNVTQALRWLGLIKLIAKCNASMVADFQSVKRDRCVN